MRRIVAAAAAAVLALGLGVAAQLRNPEAALALDNGLAATPAMAFNTWTHFRCDYDEALIESVVDTMVSTGLRDKGYQYVVLDDCWMSSSRDSAGNLVADPTKFPHGIKALADYIHAHGMKFGIYEDAGTKTCGGFPGSYDHEQQDARLFASWDVDYLKYDWCSVPYKSFPGQSHDDVAQILYTRMSDALAATGRPILFDMCNGWDANVTPWRWAGQVANQWRIGHDPRDDWNWIDYSFNRNVGLSQYAGPGGWNNPGHIVAGLGNLTQSEYISQFSLWSEMAAPLQFSTDVTTADPKTLAILGNANVIAVDQDPLGKQGYPVSHENGRWVLTKPLANGDRAVVLFNETPKRATISTTAPAIGLSGAPAYTVKDLWSGQRTETAGTISASIGAHGVAMYRVAMDHDWANYPPATRLSIDADSATPAFSAQPGKPTTVRTTLTNTGQQPVTGVTMSLDAPDGWTVRPTSATSANELGTNRAFTTTWRVTPAATDAPASEPGTCAYWYGTYQLHDYWTWTHYWNDCNSTTYRYAASTKYTWDEGKKSASTTTSARVDLVRPTTPPSGTSYVSDLQWTWAENYWGPIEVDTSNGTQATGDGEPITIRGKTYAKGLGTNSPSDIVYYLGGDCSTVTTDVGIDDEKVGKGSADFQIFADGTKKADSGVVTGDDAAPKTMTADVSGATWLRLVTSPTDDGPYNDHADWAGTTITCS